MLITDEKLEELKAQARGDGVTKEEFLSRLAAVIKERVMEIYGFETEVHYDSNNVVWKLPPITVQAGDYTYTWRQFWSRYSVSDHCMWLTGPYFGHPHISSGDFCYDTNVKEEIERSYYNGNITHVVLNTVGMASSYNEYDAYSDAQPMRKCTVCGLVNNTVESEDGNLCMTHAFECMECGRQRSILKLPVSRLGFSDWGRSTCWKPICSDCIPVSPEERLFWAISYLGRVIHTKRQKPLQGEHLWPELIFPANLVDDMALDAKGVASGNNHSFESVLRVRDNAIASL